MKTKVMTNLEGRSVGISNYPNFSVSGSTKGMKEKFYGKDALLVRCGSYIYNVTANPNIYHLAH